MPLHQASPSPIQSPIPSPIQSPGELPSKSLTQSFTDADPITFNLPDDMRLAIAAAILSELYRLNDAGGESMGRSTRALLAESAQAILGHPPGYAVADAACRADPLTFVRLAQQCLPEVLTPEQASENRGYLLAGCPTSIGLRQYRSAIVQEMQNLLYQHGWPHPAVTHA